MNKDNFLRNMERALQGQVSDYIIAENIQYYRDFIDNEMRNGKSEYDVINTLGDPRLLAKTIIDMQKNSDVQREYNTNNSNRNNKRGFHFLSGFRGCFIAFIILLVVLLVVVIFRIVLAIALFLALPVCIILIIVSILKRLR